MPSAVLLVGMRGLPAMPYAAELADGLVCGAPAEGRACGRCPHCRLVAAGTHPDRWTLRPEGSQIRIDTVREAVAWAAYRPQMASLRVVHVDSVERMGAEAAVAALKAVEEPPAGTHWVLSTDAPGRVHLPLRSRCVAFPLRPVPTPDIASWLAALGVDHSVADDLAREAVGFPDDALEAAGLSQTVDHEDPHELARGLRRQVYQGLRAGRVDGGTARRALSLWALAELGMRRASPARLVVDVLMSAADLLGAADA